MKETIEFCEIRYKYWANKITRGRKETAWDTPQGVVVMIKQMYLEKLQNSLFV